VQVLNGHLSGTLVDGFFAETLPLDAGKNCW
jgi:hypothetical protein